MKMRRQYLPGRSENIRDHIRKERKSIIKRYQPKRTVGHTGIARECFAQRGNRTRSPHFKRELSGGSMSLQLYFRYPVAKSTTFRYGVPFAHAARFSPAILTIRSNVSGRKKFPAT